VKNADRNTTNSHMFSQINDQISTSTTNTVLTTDFINGLHQPSARCAI